VVISAEPEGFNVVRRGQFTIDVRSATEEGWCSSRCPPETLDRIAAIGPRTELSEVNRLEPLP
jgi:hypothetical protein